MRAPGARSLALDALLAVEAGGFSDQLVGATLARAELDPREAALLTRLVYGAIAWQRRLDWTLAALLHRPLERLDPPVRIALRMGLLQLAFLDRVPPHAAVDTSVELVKQRGNAAGAKLVNAVLRRAHREEERPLPDPASEPVVALAIQHSHPDWLVARWLDELGPERTAALLEADNRAAPSVVRVDRRCSSVEGALAALAARGIAARPTQFSRDALEIEGPLRAALGVPWLHPQGEASLLVVDLLAPAPGERIVDLCAAPGGKSGAIAERLDAESPAVVAMDRSPRGVRAVRALALREPPRRVVTMRGDAGAPPLPDASFDAALLDAPCSGLGTLREHPEIRWRRTPADVAALAAAQRRLIASAARLVRPGGRLVYATCTLLRAENEDVVAAFLDAHRDWHPDPAEAALSGATAHLVDAHGVLRTAPDRGNLDGFFAARLRRAPS